MWHLLLSMENCSCLSPCSFQGNPITPYPCAYSGRCVTQSQIIPPSEYLSRFSQVGEQVHPLSLWSQVLRLWCGDILAAVPILYEENLSEWNIPEKQRQAFWWPHPHFWLCPMSSSLCLSSYLSSKAPPAPFFFELVWVRFLGLAVETLINTGYVER